MDKKELIDASIDSAVGLIPAFAGLTGDPLWVAPATVIAPFLQQQFKEVTEVYSNGKKVDYSKKCMGEAIATNIQNGKHLREDSFFEWKYNPQLEINESSASKLTEGGLLKAKEE